MVAYGCESRRPRADRQRPFRPALSHDIGTIEVPFTLEYIKDTRSSPLNGLIKKWGNSAAVRIPAAVMEAAHVNLGQSVEIKEEHGRIVIEPVRSRVFPLEKLIGGITSANLHNPVNMRSARGREVW